MVLDATIVNVALAAIQKDLGFSQSALAWVPNAYVLTFGGLMQQQLSLMAAPTQVRWNYSYACNFNCSHCYTRADWYPKELSPIAYARIADQLIGAG